MKLRSSFFARHPASLLSVALACSGAPALAWDTSYLQGLLNSTPTGGWVQVNSTPYSAAWATEAQGGLAQGTYSDPGAIVRAWSSFGWDSNRGNLILFGGGHANYMGNEVYLWSGVSGAWSRGSLPSRSQSVSGIPGAFSGEYVVVDGAAPLSMHTYENNVFLPTIDRMVVLGGAAFNSGGATRKLENGTLVATGPWLWDPNKANPNRVGGTTGSGYLPSTIGGEMWTDRRPFFTGFVAGGTIDSSTAYRMENGRDVVYAARMSQGNGWPDLYRFTAGNPAAGEFDRWEWVATSSYSAANFQSSGTIDLDNNLYARTAFQASSGRYGLGVWDLALANPANPDATRDRFISLEFQDGTPFQTNTNYAIAYDSVNSRFVLWDGSNRGEVFYVDAEYLANGSLDPTWTVLRGTPTTSAQPAGNFVSAAGSLGVLGKWQYIPELEAFMALDMYNDSTLDAGVWLYKPLAAVPEPGAGLLMTMGGVVIFLWSRRRRFDG